MKKLTLLLILTAHSALAGIIDLGSLSGFSTHDLASNDSGQVVGYYTLPGDIHHAFIYSKGVLIDLNPADNIVSEALVINNAGQIAGVYYNINHPGLTDGFIYSNGVFTTLQYHYQEYSQTTPASINDGGVIVGTTLTYPWHGSRLTNDLSPHAFMYKDGVMTDLNVLLPFGSEWELTEATKINNDGSIVGRGLIHGETHDFILIP